jgi:hypothetical protein
VSSQKSPPKTPCKAPDSASLLLLRASPPEHQNRSSPVSDRDRMALLQTPVPGVQPVPAPTNDAPTPSVPKQGPSEARRFYPLLADPPGIHTTRTCIYSHFYLHSPSSLTLPQLPSHMHCSHTPVLILTHSLSLPCILSRAHLSRARSLVLIHTFTLALSLIHPQPHTHSHPDSLTFEHTVSLLHASSHDVSTQSPHPLSCPCSHMYHSHTHAELHTHSLILHAHVH